MLKTIVPLALLLAAAAPAAATPGAISAVSARVHFADLNLASAGGAAELDRRIAHAVDSLCPAPDSRSLSEALDVRHCRDTAYASIAAQREQALDRARENGNAIASGR